MFARSQLGPRLNLDGTVERGSGVKLTLKATFWRWLWPSTSCMVGRAGYRAVLNPASFL